MSQFLVQSFQVNGFETKIVYDECQGFTATLNHNKVLLTLPFYKGFTPSKEQLFLMRKNFFQFSKRATNEGTHLIIELQLIAGGCVFSKSNDKPFRGSMSDSPDSLKAKTATPPLTYKTLEESLGGSPTSQPPSRNHSLIQLPRKPVSVSH